MSLHPSTFEYLARTVNEARAKLHLHHAPAAVKALIEKALDAIPAPKSELPSASGADAASGGERNYVATTRSLSSDKEPVHFGVMVEVWGSIADAGSGGLSEMQRFVVRPLAA